MSTARERLYRTEAIVLSRVDLKEADRIFSVFTPRYGKIRVIAKGVRKPNSRMAPHLEYFSRVHLLLSKGRDLDVVTSAETLERFDGLRGDLDAYANASYVAELLNRLTEDGEEHRAVFDLLARTLSAIDSGGDGFPALRSFEFGLLEELGFRPELHACVVCRAAITAVPNLFSGQLGGMLCPNCRSADPAAPELSVNAQKWVRLLDREGIERAAAFQLSDTLRFEVERALQTYCRHLLDRDLRSPGVGRAIRATLQDPV